MKIVGVLYRLENSKEIEMNYLKAIKKYGGVPLLINEYNLDLLNICKGILITGGDDKGELDDVLIKFALDNNLPLLGICQGMQSMAIYNTDNKLISVDNHYKNNEKYAHNVYLKESKLKKIIKTDIIKVNSYHYQTVESSKIFEIVGLSDDNIIEAIENSNHRFQIGVQWHPERMIEYDCNSEMLIKTFIESI